MANLNLRDGKRDFKPTEKSMRLLREYAGRAEEQLEVHERDAAKKMRDHRERKDAANAAAAATPEHQRKMDAKHRVAADLAQAQGIPLSDAERFVRGAMERGDKIRGG